MKRHFIRVGGKSSPLALLGVSTIVLIAAGETVLHTNATGAETRAVVMAGVETAPSAEVSADATREMMMIDPLFKPFVYVELPLPSGCTLLEEAGLHMNNDGVVVATMNNGSNNYGYIWRDEEFSTGWQGPLEDASGDIVLDDFGLRGINDELEICGTRDSSGPKAFFLALSSAYTGTLTQIGSSGGYAKDVNNQGVVVGTSTGGSPIGWWDIIGSPVPLPGNGTNAMGVTPNTILADSLIVGQAKSSGSIYQAALWYYDTAWHTVELTNNQYTSEVGFAADANDNGVVVGGILTSGSISDTIMWYYDGSTSQWVGVTQGTSTDFIPEAINDQQYPEVVGENYLWICDDVSSGTGTQIDLSAYSLGLPTNMINMRCTDINNDGEIVGVGQLGSGGAWVAFKLVPYDVNNNGESDVREMALAYEPDNNGNWLIDWAEDMRVGLHAPGLAEDPEGKLDPVQIVRMRVNIKPRAGNGPEGLPEDDYIDQIVNTASYCANCTAFAQKISDWGTGATRESPGTDQQSEIIVRVHSLMGENDSGWGDHEGLPDDGTDPDLRTEALEDIQSFAYRFAHCIDYLQWGNESFYGAGRYKFRDGELDCDSFADGTDFEGLPTNCKAPAAAAINTWQDQQMWAALVGSALAGRPLRMITTGFGAARINGTAPSTVAAQVIDGISDWANANQMYMALHVHYTTVQEAKDAIEKLTGTGSYTNPPWSVPDHRIATEVGTKADFPSPGHEGDGWWEDGTPLTNGVIHNRFFWGANDPPETWEAFVGGWETFADSWNPSGEDPGFRVGDVFGYFNAVDFQAICWTALQYDPGDEEHPSPFLVESLRGTEVRDENFFGQNNETDRFSPLVDDYETAGGTYENDPFAPHDSPCSTGETCPGCGG